MAKKSPIDHVATENQSCGCHKKLSKKDIELYKSRLNKFKVQNIDDTDLFSVPINFHIVADQEFFDTNGYEEQVRENIMNNVAQLNLDWNGRNSDRNRNNIPQEQFWANRGEQDKFSFYVNSIRSVNTDGTKWNANTFINYGRTQEKEKFGDYYRYFNYAFSAEQEDQNDVSVYPYDSLSDIPTPPSDLNGFYEVDGQYYTWVASPTFDFVNDPNNQPALPVEYVYGYINGLYDNDITSSSEVRLKGTKANVPPLPEYLYYPYPQSTYFRAISRAVDQDKSLNVWLVPDILSPSNYLDENNNSVQYWYGGKTAYATFPDIDHPQTQGIVMLLGAAGSLDKPSQVSLPASMYTDSIFQGEPFAPFIQKDGQGNILPNSDVKSSPYKYDKPQADGTTKATPRLTARIQNGRILTHEVGHYFGLTHTWGDVTDDNGDFVCGGPLQVPTLDPEVNDPMISHPKQKGPSSTRSVDQSSFIMANECTVDAPWVQSEGVMWQNFMDYAIQGYFTTQFMFTKQQQDASQAICTDDDSERKILSQPDRFIRLKQQSLLTEASDLPNVMSTQGHAVSNVVLDGQTVTAIVQNREKYDGWK